MNTTTLRLILAGAAATIITACGGSSGGSTPTPLATNPAIGTLTSTAGSTQLTMTIVSGTPASAAKTAAARKNPQYVSPSTRGLQVTISGNGTSAVYNYSTSGAVCNSNDNGYTKNCTFTFPTLAPTETISILELNQLPNGTADPVTGLSSSPFPASSGILATGSITTTLTPGAITQLAIGLNPIVAHLYDDCGIIASAGAIAMSTTRIVMTGNAVARAIINVEDEDYSNRVAQPAVTAPSSSPIAQPFVDVNGSPQPIKGTSSSTHFTFLPMPATTAAPTAPPGGAYVATATIPDATKNSANWGGFFIAVQYDGSATPSPSVNTLTFDNQLSATAPVFLGTPLTPAPPATYHASLVYTIAPVFATPATFSLAASTSAQVTAYDPGAASNMVVTPCQTSGAVTIGTLTSNGSIAAGMQTFTFAASATTGTCTFTLKDGATNIPSNTVTVTIQ